MSQQSAAELTKETIAQAFQEVQNHISSWLVEQTGQNYMEDRWQYAPKGDGGGISRVWEGEYPNSFIEKGGVNFSALHGSSLPKTALANFTAQFGPDYKDIGFFATGVSLVIHPVNPHIPTIHMNIRYFEAGPNVWWFGGGIDVTPYYPNIDEVVEFHRSLKQLCEEHGQSYEAYKEACDKYFYLKHRGETRGVGGIFFDHLKDDKQKLFEFTKALGFAFTKLYAPFVENNRNKPHTEQQREFQLIRRSRYVEFNLLFDRGTKFGIESEGRTESILMSLPTVAKWKYNWKPAPNSIEEKVVTQYLKPQNWLALTPEELSAIKL